MRIEDNFYLVDYSSNQVLKIFNMKEWYDNAQNWYGSTRDYKSKVYMTYLELPKSLVILKAKTRVCKICVKRALRYDYRDPNPIEDIELKFRVEKI